MKKLIFSLVLILSLNNKILGDEADCKTTGGQSLSPEVCHKCKEFCKIFESPGIEVKSELLDLDQLESKDYLILKPTCKCIVSEKKIVKNKK